MCGASLATALHDMVANVCMQTHACIDIWLPECYVEQVISLTVNVGADRWYVIRQCESTFVSDSG